MATDNAIASPDALAAGWPRRLPDGAALGDAGVLPPEEEASDEGARDAPKPRDCAARAADRIADRAEMPGAPHAAALAAPAAIAGTLDFVGLPALVVDSLGRVLDANRAARPILARGLAGGLRVVNGRLAAGSHRTSIALRNLVRQAAARAMPPVVVPQPDRHPLLVYAFPVPDGAPGAPPGGCALVIVLDLGTRSTPPAVHLQHAFGLTEAQSRVAALLAGGVNLDTAAEMLGISKETARGHLRGVFARTGVRRQPELVALVGRLLPVGAGALSFSPQSP